MAQSLPIIEYLEERLVEPWLGAAAAAGSLPAGRRARGLAEIVNSGIQPHQNLTTTNKLKALGVDDAAWVKGSLPTA